MNTTVTAPFNNTTARKCFAEEERRQRLSSLPEEAFVTFSNLPLFWGRVGPTGSLDQNDTHTNTAYPHTARYTGVELSGWGGFSASLSPLSPDCYSEHVWPTSTLHSL